MTTFDGHGARNWAGTPQRGQKPRGQSALDVIVEGGFLPATAGPVEFAAWLRAPIDALLIDLNDIIDARISLIIAPTLAQAEASATAAAASATQASVHETNAETAADAAAQSAQDALDAVASVVAGSLGQGAIFGLTLSNNGANPTTHIDVSVGQCRSSDNQVDLVLASGITKRLDAVWAAGTNNGGRDSATALAVSQSYHVFVIYDPTNDLTDVLFSQSPTAPTLPTNYTKFRRIGSLPRLGTDVEPVSGTAIPAFIQTNNTFRLKTRTRDYATQSGSSSPLLRDIRTPIGVKMNALLYFQLVSDGTATFGRITDPSEGVPAAFGGTDQWGQVRLSGNELYLVTNVRVYTNTAAQVYVHVSYTGGIWALGVLGWEDDRGLQS